VQSQRVKSSGNQPLNLLLGELEPGQDGIGGEDLLVLEAREILQGGGLFLKAFVVAPTRAGERFNAPSNCVSTTMCSRYALTDLAANVMAPAPRAVNARRPAVFIRERLVVSVLPSVSIWRPNLASCAWAAAESTLTTALRTLVATLLHYLQMLIRLGLRGSLPRRPLSQLRRLPPKTLRASRSDAIGV